MTQDFEGRCWTQSHGWKDDPAQWGIECLEANVSASGLSTKKGTINTNRNSGAAAINLAYHLGAKRILLLGFDMKHKGARHWFGEHPKNLNQHSDYAGFAERFRSILPERYGIEIWNVTRDTALDAFPRYDLDEVCAALS